MSDREELVRVYGEAGGDCMALADGAVGHLAVSSHSIMSCRTVPGLEINTRETGKGIAARVLVKKGVQLEHPVHFCFGVLHERGRQEIDMDVQLEEESSAVFIAHCIFPNARKLLHAMDARIVVGQGAHLRYSETHYHGISGGITVVPRLRVQVQKHGTYLTDFSLLDGRVGRLDIDYNVSAGEEAIAELTARVFGHADDSIRIREKVVLAGENARGLIKARVAIEGRATAEIQGITEGNAAGCRGHVDCMEIVKDRAVAKAVPLVQVSHPLAKVTHEAAIGSVDKRQMETLMAHGLSPEEAVDMIVKGILR